MKPRPLRAAGALPALCSGRDVGRDVSDTFDERLPEPSLHDGAPSFDVADHERGWFTVRRKPCFSSKVVVHDVVLFQERGDESNPARAEDRHRFTVKRSCNSVKGVLALFLAAVFGVRDSEDRLNWIDPEDGVREEDGGLDDSGHRDSADHDGSAMWIADKLTLHEEL